MNENIKDNIYYVSSMIEYVSRMSKNHRGYVAECLGEKGISHELESAEVNHCLSFDQVSDEWIKYYKIADGDFDTVKTCEYDVPPVTAIGRVYQGLIISDMEEKNIDANEAVLNVFTSFISDKISDFNTSTFYSSPDYLRCSYNAGVLLM